MNTNNIYAENHHLVRVTKRGSKKIKSLLNKYGSFNKVPTAKSIKGNFVHRINTEKGTVLKNSKRKWTFQVYNLKPVIFGFR